MSVISMTGFGRGASRARGLEVVVELGSVNRRQFECHFTVPRELAPIEARLHGLVQAKVRRGQVRGSVAVAGTRGGRHVRVDLTLAGARVRALRAAARQLGLADDLRASQLMAWPDVLTGGTPGCEAAGMWPLVARAARQAVRRLDAMRRREGRALARDIAAYLRTLHGLSGAIAGRAPRVVVAHRLALRARLMSLRGGVAPDAGALARELALVADRCDIREELTRLASHLNQAEKALAGRAACGRTLDFICQEMFREINTAGAKANDAAISRRVVAFKTALEGVREQIQNVE